MNALNEDIIFSPKTSEVVFSTAWFHVHKEKFAEPHSTLDPYYTVASGDGCFVIPFTEDGNVIAINQFRPPLRRYTLELPAGAIDPDENPEAAAGRELFEETGYVHGELILIGKGQMMMNRFSGGMFGYVAHNCVQKQTPPPDCRVCVSEMPWVVFLNLVKSGDFFQMDGMGFLLLAKLKNLLPEKNDFSI